MGEVIQLMTKDEIAKIVANDLIFHHVALSDETEWTFQNKLNDFGMDSLALVEFGLRILDRFGLADTDTNELKLEGTTTVARVAEVLHELISAQEGKKQNG